MVQASLSAPASMYHQLSKQNLRRSDVYLTGVMWETTDILCASEACGHVTDGYGNYVTRLAAEVKTQAAQIEALQAQINTTKESP
ncbi:hypothetical protein LP414_27475 [Polaromonas sp. P1(28)-13]|nr:hypothetical protein LP414_27475 [Polaromonas sp. P1(28)-13]